jgi:uncharacterized membrane protein YdjX (TVP38/TMEM64 family)
MPTKNASATNDRARIWFKVILGVMLVGAALWLGRKFGHHIPALEEWIAGQGVLGYAAFVGIVVLCTSLFVPDTVFAVMAGALFGVLGGTAVMAVGCLLTAALDFVLARSLLEGVVRGWLARKPHLAAIQQAVNREGFRFQFLLRLTPVNPVTVSYMLGATGARFAPFLAACLGLLPTLFVEVYFGYVAKHVAKISGHGSEHSTLHSAMTIAGLALCIVMLAYIVRLARRALAEIQDPAPRNS